MEESHPNSSSQVIFGLIVFALLIFGGAYFLPWKNINWGNLNIKPANTVTVTGEAKSQIKSQIANYGAGVNAVNDNKDTAISEVNGKITAIITALKNFGIADKDIKTQNLSVYQQQENYYEDGRQKLRPGQWNVNNSLDITLRNIDQAPALADLLTKTGATNVYGPNFMVDNTTSAQNELLGEAMKDALIKAEIIARASDKKVGEVVSVTEGSSAVGFFPMSAVKDGAGGGGGAPVQPGSQTVQKNVTVVYELK